MSDMLYMVVANSEVSALQSTHEPEGEFMSRVHFVARALMCSGLTLVLAACGGGGSDGGGDVGTARATIIFSADDTTRSTVVGDRGTGPVPIEDILSLTVTVTEVVLQRCEGGDDDASDLQTVLVEDFEFDPTSVEIEEGGMVRWVWTENTLHTITSGLIGDLDAGSEFDESADTAGDVVEIIFEDAGEYPYFSDTETDIQEGMTGVVRVVNDDDDDEIDEDDDGGQETVFQGSVDVNVLDLTALSEVLSSAIIPAGDYCRIIIRITDPRLVLVSDPNTVITNVQLTANGRLFIQDHFDLNDGDEVLIIVSFGSIHLVETGVPGRYVLTPQLRADVTVEDATVLIAGTIETVDDETLIITVRTESNDLFEVFADGTTVIHTDDDADDPDISVDVTLAFADLEVGQDVLVTGLLTVGGQVEADDIEVADDSIVTP